MEKSRELWNQVMQSGFGNQAQWWLDYFNLERYNPPCYYKRSAKCGLTMVICGKNSEMGAKIKQDYGVSPEYGPY